MKRNTVLIALFIAAIIGLSVVQYQYFRIGLNLAGLQFNDQMSKAIVEIQEDLEQRNELTYLMGTVLTENKQNFKKSGFNKVGFEGSTFGCVPACRLFQPFGPDRLYRIS